MRTLRLILLPLLAPLLVSCLATRAALENAEAATARLNAVMDSQTATVGDLQHAAGEQADALADLGDAVVADIANAIELAKTGTPWGELLGTAAGSIVLAYLGTNKARDMKRAQRGEPTGITKET